MLPRTGVLGKMRGVSVHYIKLLAAISSPAATLGPNSATELNNPLIYQCAASTSTSTLFWVPLLLDIVATEDSAEDISPPVPVVHFDLEERPAPNIYRVATQLARRKANAPYSRPTTYLCRPLHARVPQLRTTSVGLTKRGSPIGAWLRRHCTHAKNLHCHVCVTSALQMGTTPISNMVALSTTVPSISCALFGIN